MFLLFILEKNWRNEDKIFTRKCYSLLKDGKLSRSKSQTINKQLSKLKYVAKNNTGTTSRVTKKNFQDDELPQELFSTTQQDKKLK